jgi:hypothetical protein
MDQQFFINLEDEFGAHNYKPLDVVLARGEGVWVWDVDGNKYMDCLAAYSKDKRLLFQCVLSENCELCIGFGCGPTY